MVLLDTHVLIWMASQPTKLSAKAKSFIKKNGSDLFYSPISAFEITLLVKKNKLTLPLDPMEYLEETVNYYSLHEASLTAAIAGQSVTLPPIHNDPVDRMLIATVMEYGGTLVSKDGNIAKYPNLKIIW